MRALSLLLLPILSVAAAAQTPVSKWDIVKALAPGMEVRVDAGIASTIVGKLESVTDSDLVLTQGTGPQSFPRAQILSVSVKKNGHRRRNTFIGMGVGTAAGIGIGYGTGYCSTQGGWCHLGEGVDAAIGGAAGLVGGTVVGLLWPTGGWRKIYAP
jgi:hypothetical protein